MKDIELKPWESISDTVKAWLPLIEQRLYPKLSGTPETGKWVRLYPEGCVSGNGGAFHGSLRLGTQKDSLIVYLNGGGVSWNAYMAAHPNGLFYGHLKDRFYFNECEWLGDGVIDNGLAALREDNPFQNWNYIDIPYTTGDFHCGNGEFRYTALDGSDQILYHRGYRNIRAVLEMAGRWLPNVKSLVIAGSSAGGFGAALMAEDIIRSFPTAENITCVVDSSVMLKNNWRFIAETIWKAPAHICSRLHTDNLALDSYTALAQNYPQAKLLFCCSPRDAALTQMRNYILGNGMSYSKEVGEEITLQIKHFCDVMAGTSENFGTYIFALPSGDPPADEMGLTRHTIFESPDTFSYKTNGTSVSEWLFRAVAGETGSYGLERLL